MEKLDLDRAQELVRTAVTKAASDFSKPICVAISDATGALIAFARADGAPLRSIAIAQAKAYTAVRMGVNTDAFLERLERENLQASYYCDEKLTPLPGGAVLKAMGGAVVGGAGISGLTSAEDQIVANFLAAMV